MANNVLERVERRIAKRRLAGDDHFPTAVIGEIANDDAGDGAAWGAAAGAIRGRRVGAQANAQAQQQAQVQAEQREQATAEQLDNFKKAFSVCLEAKNYMVK